MTIWEHTIMNLNKSKSELAREARSLIGKLERDMIILCEDPMTTAYGAPIDDIFFSRRKKHIAACNDMYKYLMSEDMVDLAEQISDEIFQWIED